MTMQIAICHENVLPARGGAEMYVADLARRLVAAGHEVHLYGCQRDGAALPAALTFHQLPPPRGPRWLRPWQFSFSVMRALQNDRPQVSLGFDKVLGTDVYSPISGLYAASTEFGRLKHRSSIMRAAARAYQEIDPAYRSYVRLECKLLTDTNRPVLVANSDLVRQHAKTYYNVDPSVVPVVHYAIDPDRFPEADRPAVRASARDTWDLGDDIVAAVVAMNYRLKGVEPLLHALRLVPQSAPLRVLIAGSPRVGPWERLARRLGVADRVRFIGRCADVRRVFFAADFLVHPTFYDPCSLVVLEALACGLPVITTKANGAGELLHPPAEGYVIDDPHNLPELAGRITDLLDGPTRRACAAAARKAALSWTFDHHVRALEVVLARAAAQRLRATG